jgi:2-methylisocitrate lyase-like PEP mutase family enzyme
MDICLLESPEHFALKDFPMTADQSARAQTFLGLHRAKPGFIMPNAWDAGSAILIAAEGFKAIATTSAGIAFSLGKPDYNVANPRIAVSRDEMLAAIARIAAAVEVPVNADLEAGYGDAPEAVAETVRLAIAAGASGGNIEDVRVSEGTLLDEDLAAERIGAARAAAAGKPFVITARTDAFLLQAPDAMNTAIRRANRYLEAGADCVFTPGPTDLASIQTLVKEIAGPLNIVMGLNESAGSAYGMLEAGVQRISVGGSIARSVMGLVRRSARELKEHGTVNYARDQIAQPELNSVFSKARLSR